MKISSRVKKGAGILGILALITLAETINRFSKSPYSIVSGVVIRKSEIPQDIPIKSQERYPFWADIMATNGQYLRLNFDTHEIGYDAKTHSYIPGLHLELGRVGLFEGQALNLENIIDSGCFINTEVKLSGSTNKEVNNLLYIIKY